MAYFGDNLFSGAYDDEASYGVQDASAYVAFESTLPQMSPAREVEELQLSSPSDMVGRDRVVGSSHGGSLTFGGPLRSQLATYDADTGAGTALIEGPLMLLLREAIGDKTTGTWVSSDIGAGSDANTWEGTAATPAPGDCYGVAADTTGALRAAGFIKSVSGFTFTMFEDSIAVPVNGDELIPMITMYPGGTAPVSKSFKIVGTDAEHKVTALGCIPSKVILDVAPGKQPTAEFTYDVDSFNFYSSGGGLLTPAAHQRIPALIGNNGGRLWLDGDTLQDGTAEPMGTCGFAGVRIEIDLELGVIPCGGSASGVATVYVRRRNAKVTFTIPHVSTWITAPMSKFQDSLVNGTTMSISAMCGDTIGQFFGVLIPAARVIAEPGYGSNDGTMGFTVEMEPTAYDGDTSGAGAADAPLRVVFG